MAVEFLRNIARSNFRPYDSCSKQVRICWTHWNQFLTVHFPSQIIFPFHHVCFLEWTFFYLSSSPVSSKLGSMGPTMWSIFPSITLHFFTAGAYLQVLLQFQSFSSTGKDSLERRKIRRYIDTNTDFFFFRQSEVILSELHFNLLKLFIIHKCEISFPAFMSVFAFSIWRHFFGSLEFSVLFLGIHFRWCVASLASDLVDSYSVFSFPQRCLQ